jgi:hypothetical protein
LADIGRGFVSPFGTRSSRQGVDAAFSKATTQSKKSPFGDVKGPCDLVTLGQSRFGELTSTELVKFAIVQGVGEEGLVTNEDSSDAFLILVPDVFANSGGPWRQAPVVGEGPLSGRLRPSLSLCLRDHFPLHEPRDLRKLRHN